MTLRVLQHSDLLVALTTKWLEQKHVEGDLFCFLLQNDQGEPKSC